MIIEIIKNYQTDRRTYLKGQVLNVLPWKAAEFMAAKAAKVLSKKMIEVERMQVETNEEKLLKEIR